MDSTRPTLLLTGYLLAAGLLLPCQAEITLDGSLGNEPGALTAGPNQEFNITEELGKKVGSNLFHSFGVFDIRSGETATFSGTSPIENILSRVTGGRASNIDGTLRTDFVNATPNLYLINPAGVLFGPSASLDVQGSFHVSTADFLRLEDGVRFASVPSAEDQVLTTAPPEAFGFLGENQPAPIIVDESMLEVSEGEKFSIIGGDITVTGGPDGFIAAPSGIIKLASLSSSGEVNMDESGVSVNHENKQGDIELTNDVELNISGAGGGSVLIRGGRFTLNNSNIFADRFGDIGGGIVDIAAQDAIEILNDSRIRALVAFGGSAASDIKLAGDSVIVANESEIITGTLSHGSAGKVTIDATNLTIDSRSDIGSRSGLFDPIFGVLDIGSGNSGEVNVTASGTVSISRLSRILSQTATQGTAGEINITSQNLLIDEDGRISASTFGAGDAGNIISNSDRVNLSGGGQISSSGGGFVSAQGTVDFGNIGRPGEITIDAKESVSVTGKSSLTNLSTNISSNTLGIADAGSILIDTPQLTVADAGVIQTNTLDKGAGGSVNIFTNELKVVSGGQIAANTFSAGRAGNIGLHATNVTIDGTGLAFSPDGTSARQASGVFANTRGVEKGSGQGGTIMLNTQSLDVRAGGRITSNTEGPGKGGNIGISANEVILEGGDDQGLVSGIFANAFGEQIDSGGSGSILLKANDLQIKDEAAIANITNGPGNGGILDISASMIQLLGGGIITTDSFGSGNSGNVAICASEVLLEGTNGDIEDVQSSQISVSTQGEQLKSGNGGNLVLTTDKLQLNGGARINASTDGTGKGGSIDIMADRASIEGHGSGILSGISARAGIGSVGDAGNINLTARSLEVLDGGQVEAQSLGLGRSGNVEVNSNHLRVEGVTVSFPSEFPLQSEISVFSDSVKGGDNLTLNTDRLEIRDGGLINAATNGPGKGADLEINSGEIILERNANNTLFPTGLSVITLFGGGEGGDLSLKTNSLEVTDGATISASTLGSGEGGTLAINASNINLENGGSITSESLSENKGAGASGSISVEARDSLRLGNGGRISVRTQLADAGDIDLRVANSLLLRTNSEITTSAAGGQGNGGNIIIDPVFVVLDDSEIRATATEGAGGNIDIVSDFIFQSPDSDINASSERGIDGTVDIDSPDTNISGSIAILPETYINAGDQLSERCGARSANLNSFTVKGRGAVPLAPEDFSPSTSRDDGFSDKISKNGTAMADRYASYIESSSGTPELTEKDGDDPHLTALEFGCGQ